MTENIITEDTPNLVDKITINYHRVTRIPPNTPISDTMPECIWDYFEQLVLDRKTETLNHIQKIGSGCVISRSYFVQDGVASLLDELDAAHLFEQNVGNGPDVITDSGETRNYQITVDFKGQPPRVIEGSYNKDGLPEDYPELAKRILDFICFYGLGEILNPFVYKKARRKTSSYIFCSVKFEEDGKSYFYLTEDDTIAVGDLVLVSVGSHDRPAKAKVMDVEYFSEEGVPFPLEKVKHILQKYTAGNFKSSVPNSETAHQDSTKSILDSGEQFQILTQYIEKIAFSESFGEWVIDRKNDGTLEHPVHMPYVRYHEIVDSFHEDFYRFSEEHPEYELMRYSETLEKRHIPWGVAARKCMRLTFQTLMRGQCPHLSWAQSGRNVFVTEL